MTASARRLWELAAEGGSSSIDQLTAALAAETGFDNPEQLTELTAVVRDTLTFMDRTGLLEPLAA